MLATAIVACRGASSLSVSRRLLSAAPIGLSGACSRRACSVPLFISFTPGRFTPQMVVVDEVTTAQDEKFSSLTKTADGAVMSRPQEVRKPAEKMAVRVLGDMITNLRLLPSFKAVFDELINYLKRAKYFDVNVSFCRIPFFVPFSKTCNIQ